MSGRLAAARAHLGGAQALGLVLINTLHKPRARLDGLNDALLRCGEVGGLELVRDLYLPLLMGQAWLRENRAGFLHDAAYTPLPCDSGAYRLLASSTGADWDLAYEDLGPPVVTGLQDRAFYEPADAQELSTRLPNGRRVDIAGAGHLLPMERLEAVSEVCLDLARRV